MLCACIWANKHVCTSGRAWLAALLRQLALWWGCHSRCGFFSGRNKCKDNGSWKAITYIKFGTNRQADIVLLAALFLSKQILDNASLPAKQWVSCWDEGTALASWLPFSTSEQGSGQVSSSKGQLQGPTSLTNAYAVFDMGRQASQVSPMHLRRTQPLTAWVSVSAGQGPHSAHLPLRVSQAALS